VHYLLDALIGVRYPSGCSKKPSAVNDVGSRES
jgi:hypothetical protein